MGFIHMTRSFPSVFVFTLIVGLMACSPSEQTPRRMPVIDAHTHLDVKTVPSVMQSLNVRYQPG